MQYERVLDSFLFCFWYSKETRMSSHIEFTHTHSSKMIREMHPDETLNKFGFYLKFISLCPNILTQFLIVIHTIRPCASSNFSSFFSVINCVYSFNEWFTCCVCGSLLFNYSGLLLNQEYWCSLGWPLNMCLLSNSILDLILYSRSNTILDLKLYSRSYTILNLILF